MRIAVVGAGVAGLVAARRLHERHDVTLFEADDRLGGHVHTWSVPLGGRVYSVDTGFIVCNDRNYPGFLSLLAELGVPTQPSPMSFSVRHDRAGLEYNGSTLRTLFAQKRNLLRPAFLRMLADVLRFNRDAPRAIAAREGTSTLGELLERGGYSAPFRDWYLVPMGSALWSCPASATLDMPARFFVEFMDNHGMLTVGARPQWRTIVGGSARYVEALTAPLGGRIRLGRPVGRVQRFPDRVEVDGERFDRAVLACHSDQALALLSDPTPAERDVLGAMPYQSNEAVLHTDTSVLPARRGAWAAWNFQVGDDPDAPAVVTYNMNVLQSLAAPETLCVTLNAGDRIDPARVIGRARYHHPVATLAGVSARARRRDISGVGRTHYCGAYWGHGFHEDGLQSALAVVGEVEGAERTGAAA